MGSGKLLASTAWGTNDQGNGALSAKHVVDFRSVIDDFIHGQYDEIDGHNLYNGSQSQHGGTCSHAHKAIFADGRIHNALRAELFQETGSDLIRALEVANLLSQQEDILIALELFTQGIM